MTWLLMTHASLKIKHTRSKAQITASLQRSPTHRCRLAPQARLLLLRTADNSATALLGPASSGRGRKHRLAKAAGGVHDCGVLQWQEGRWL